MAAVVPPTMTLDARHNLLPPSVIVCNPLNPRKDFDQAEIVRFGYELKEHSIKQPLRVFARGEQFVLISGERRLRAAIAVGIPQVPCLVEPPPANDAALILDQLVENDGHKSLSAIERGEAYQQLLRLNGWSAAELAKALCISPSEVSRALSIRNGLDPTLHPHVQSGKLLFSLASELAKVRNYARQRELAAAVLERGMTRAELIHLIKSEKSRKESPAGKPVRLLKSFDPAKGYEGIKSELTALLDDVQRAAKNNLPIAYLGDLWAQRV